MTTQAEISSRIDTLLADAGIQSLVSHMTYAEIAKELHEAQSDLSGFAEACYDMNSVSELVEGLNSEADDTDMQNWGIDEMEWEAAIKQALFAKAFDEIYDDLIDAEKEWYDAE